MSFTTLFIKKPVLSVVISLLLLMIGLVSYFKLAVREYPKISASVVNITTAYPGASAQTMESYVTSPIERALSGLDGVDYISSNSTMGTSTVTIHFNLGVDISQGVSDARDKVSAARHQLPQEANEPIVIKNDPNSNPIMYIAFTSNNMSPEKVTDYLKRVIQPNFQNINGVGEARILGGRDYIMRIMLNPQSMANHNVTADEIMNALSRNQIHPPAGRIKSKEEEYEVSAQTDVNTAKAFNHLIISARDGHITRLQDIAQAKLAPTIPRFSVFVNEQQGVLMAVVGKSDSSPLKISAGIKQSLERLKPQFPGDLQVAVVWDNSLFIGSSLHEVKHTIIEASLCVILVMFVFLGSLRMLSIPLVTIPLSLIGICSLMLAMGFTINTMTLLAMVLAIGLVVDDSIVVAENIHRHIEEGLTPKEAAITGTKEIQFAIMSMTITLAAVFTPIGFLTGLTGSLFREFAFTLAGTVIISGFIALTLSPMMCSKIINAKALKGKLPTKINEYFNIITSGYQWLLRKILKLKVIVPIILVASIFIDFGLYSRLERQLAPKEDPGAALVSVTGPPNANINYTEQYTQRVDKILKQVPEHKNICMINGMNGPNSALSFLTLQPWGKRDRNIQEITDQLNGQLRSIPGVKAFALNPFSLPGANGIMPIGFVLQSTGSYDDLYDAKNQIINQMRQSGLFMNVTSSLKADTPQITVDIHRDLAGNLGIPMSKIASTINFGLGNPQVADFSMGGRSYGVIPEIMPEFKKMPENLNNLYVRSKFGNLVPLGNLITIKEETKTQSLSHFDQLRSAEITAGLAPGHYMGEAIDFLKTSISKIDNGNIQYNFTNESRQFLTAGNNVLFTFVFALLLIILLLSAQFESFISPFIVLSGLFFSVTGALWALNLWSYSSNIYTQIGLVTLIGLISKHGILIVEFSNQLREQGKSSYEAVVQSSTIRLRPILMTTAAMVLGAIPLLLASGAGSESRKQIGLVIVSGMSIGTLMTIFVVPSIYLIVEDVKSWGQALWRKKQNNTASKYEQ